LINRRKDIKKVGSSAVTDISLERKEKEKKKKVPEDTINRSIHVWSPSQVTTLPKQGLT